MVDVAKAQNCPMSDEDLRALALTRPEAVAAYKAAHAEMEACRGLLDQLWVCPEEKRAVVGALFVAERLAGVVSRWIRARGALC